MVPSSMYRIHYSEPSTTLKGILNFFNLFYWLVTEVDLPSLSSPPPPANPKSCYPLGPTADVPDGFPSHHGTSHIGLRMMLLLLKTY